MLSECTQTQRGTSASPNGSNGGGSGSGSGSGSSGIGNSASSSTSGNTTTSSSNNTTSTSSTTSTSGGSSGSSNMAISRVPSPPPPEASTPVAENWCYTQVTPTSLVMSSLYQFSWSSECSTSPDKKNFENYCCTSYPGVTSLPTMVPVVNGSVDGGTSFRDLENASLMFGSRKFTRQGKIWELLLYQLPWCHQFTHCGTSFSVLPNKQSNSST